MTTDTYFTITEINIERATQNIQVQLLSLRFLRASCRAHRCFTMGKVSQLFSNLSEVFEAARRR